MPVKHIEIKEKTHIVHGKKRKFFVAYENGVQVSSARKSDLNVDLHTARELYKKNNAFTTDYYQSKNDFPSGVKERGRLYYDHKKVPKKPEFRSNAITNQYVIGTFSINGEKGIFARSDRIESSSVKSINKAIQQAEHRFFGLIDKFYTGGYDEGDGRELVIQNDIKTMRGFISYTASDKQKSKRLSNRK